MSRNSSAEAVVRGQELEVKVVMAGTPEATWAAYEAWRSRQPELDIVATSRVVPAGTGFKVDVFFRRKAPPPPRKAPS